MIPQFEISRRRMIAGIAAVGLASTLGSRLAVAQESDAASTAGAADGTTAAWTKFNLNVAGEEQFGTIPGVGERMIGEFQEYRPYASIEQFRREIGKYVDEAQVAAYERYVFVPVDPSTADAATLQQLPGVDEEIATALAGGQPYSDDAAFLAALGQHVSAEQAAAAGAYLASTAGAEAAWPKFNLNTAAAEQFLTIPGVGDRMVDEFFEYRPYTSIEQFRREIGKYVEDNVVAGYEAYVFVPVDPSQADAETLKQLPGVDDEIAEQVSGGEPYPDVDAFVTALGQHVSAEQAETARAFLTAS